MIEMDKINNIPCYGIIIIKELDEECVLVKKKDGNYGFPKGKRHKKETAISTAFREVEEETGLQNHQLTLVNNIYLDELSSKGNVSVRYLLAKYTYNHKHKFNFDSNELEESNWFKFDIAMDKLKSKRKKILQKTLDLFQTNPKMISGTELKSINDKEQHFKKNQKKLVNLNNTLTWILLHKAVVLGLKINEEGYILIEDILKLKQLKDINFNDIKQAVETNNKKIFTIIEINNKNYIKINNFSKKIAPDVIETNKLLFKVENPLPICVHKATKEQYTSIKTEGLKIEKGFLQFESEITENQKNNDVLIYLDMELAMQDGIIFFANDNKLILTEGNNGIILPKYFKRVVIKHQK